MSPQPLRTPALEADNLAHGFFTREGGVSRGLHAGLNCGYGSADERAAVARNRAMVAANLAVADAHLLTTHQTHGTDVIIVSEAWAPGAAPRADGMVSRQPGIALGILTADCAPVLFADAAAGVVGAAHAGWRGALSGILEATVRTMAELGAAPARITAAIGPTIAQGSYQVGAEFHQAFVAADARHARYFAPSSEAGRWQFDLPAFVADRLAALSLAAVVDLARDTYDETAKLYSYRRATHRGEDDYGRQISAIALVAPDRTP
ncbi:MAG: peptidoglycan editing factor PgeF [Alphaproteobacteria bacterium]|jgi:hypothetical protein|nr:peptidoglycan editing factor PgeF [Alphaproteobacteria bacterium]MDP6563204.1 peptidoglycan editing factor PgeF [Alphaproteobacteria bacterium]MDP6814775.1 peptidoglycan editing factor PgeF [Alphaproteobacteria bacterium]